MFSESVKKCIKNYINIKGRTSRAVYWYFILLVFICQFLQMLFLVDAAVFSGSMSMILMFVFILINLFLLIPTITATCRRLHDIGKPAPWFFIFLIPLIGIILWIVWTTKKSDGNNQFGKKHEIDN